MKLTNLTAAAALSLAPATSAWRVYLYSFADYSGSTLVYCGRPGQPRHRVSYVEPPRPL